MACRAVIPAPLGRAIMKINENDDRYSDEEEYATTIENLMKLHVRWAKGTTTGRSSNQS